MSVRSARESKPVHAAETRRVLARQVVLAQALFVLPAEGLRRKLHDIARPIQTVPDSSAAPGHGYRASPPPASLAWPARRAGGEAVASPASGTGAL